MLMYVENRGMSVAMNPNPSELTTGTELELTYDGSNGERTITAHLVGHEAREATLDKYGERHELTFAEPGARRPRFLRFTFETPTDGTYSLADDVVPTLRSLNSKSDRGRRLGRLRSVEVVGDSPEWVESLVALRSAETGDVLTVEGERGTVVSNGLGTTVEFDDGTQATLRTSASVGAYEYVEHEQVARHVEATGESVEAPEADREAFETCESYGNDDERGKVVAVEHAGETYEVAYRHDADDEGIRFETPERHGHDTLELDPLGLVLDGERVHADDLELVFENDEQAESDDETETETDGGPELVADGGTDPADLERGENNDADDVSEGEAVLVHYESVYGETGDDSHEVRGTVVEAGGVRVVVEATDGETYDLVLDGGLAVELEKRDSHDNPRRVGFPTAVASSGEQGDEPQFETGERVTDADDDEGGKMRVLDPDAGLAGEVEVGTTGVVVSEYDGNEDVPDDERVVECVFEGFLDSNVPEWELTPAAELPEFLDAYADEWGVPMRSYTYPESRLTQAESGDEADGPGDDTNDDDGDESGPSDSTMPAPVVDVRDDGDYDVPEPSDDLPTEAEREQGDEGGDTQADAGRFLALPTPEAVARHVAPFPAFSPTWRHEAAVHELVVEQVERVVEVERGTADGREVIA